MLNPKTVIASIFVLIIGGYVVGATVFIGLAKSLTTAVNNHREESTTNKKAAVAFCVDVPPDKFDDCVSKQIQILETK